MRSHGGRPGWALGCIFGGDVWGGGALGGAVGGGACVDGHVALGGGVDGRVGGGEDGGFGGGEDGGLGWAKFCAIARPVPEVAKKKTLLEVITRRLESNGSGQISIFECVYIYIYIYQTSSAKDLPFLLLFCHTQRQNFLALQN